ncbi:MAG TPA: SEC-C domain-containing protein [Candidatus Eisenbacteria bacterium]|nr:SEC-C domain-containing protein [Candidatus Eisenbacteria bacterium]
MSSIGRNDPCPCGSGLKFKQCCSSKTGAQSYTANERSRALTALMRFSDRDEFLDWRKAAFDLFWRNIIAEASEEELARALALEQVKIAYNSWFLFDFTYDQRTVLDLFLEREGTKLNPGERRYLEGMKDSHLRLYEILDVRAEEGFEVRDLWENRTLWVRERIGTRQLVRWDLPVGRLGKAPDGENIFEAVPYVFPAAVKEPLLRSLRKAHRLYGEEVPGGSTAGFFKTIGPVLHEWWIQEVVLRPAPKLVTPEGDPVILANAVFDLFDSRRVRELLHNHPAIDDDGGGSYGWNEPAGNLRRSLGAIRIDQDRLILETVSKSRAERGRDFLERLLGDAVRFRATTYEDIHRAMERATPSRKREQAAVPAAVQAQVVGEFYEQHYRAWMNEPVPALGNRTPRHAAKLKSVRPKLIALLKEFESRSERRKRAGEPAYDFAWMWEELGLKRE